MRSQCLAVCSRPSSFRVEVGDTGMALGKAHRLKKPSGAGSPPAASIQDGAAVPQSLLIGLPRSIGRSSATHNAGSRDWRLHAPIHFYREGLSVTPLTDDSHIRS